MALVPISKTLDVPKKNDFMQTFVRVMQNPTVKGLLYRSARSDLEWKTLHVYVSMYRKIESFYGAEPIPEDVASWMLYRIMSQPKYCRKAVASMQSWAAPRPKKYISMVS